MNKFNTHVSRALKNVSESVTTIKRDRRKVIEDQLLMGPSHDVYYAVRPFLHFPSVLFTAKPKRHSISILSILTNIFVRRKQNK